MSEKFLYYFAYGSNLLPARIGRRCPSARLLGPAKAPGFKLGFQKQGQDRSAKATLFRAPGKIAWGALFLISPEDRKALDGIEGLGRGYELEEGFRVLSGREKREIRAATYLASPGYVCRDLKPFHWYRALVLAGALQHAFPKKYCRQIRATKAIRDPHRARPGFQTARQILQETGYRHLLAA